MSGTIAARAASDLPAARGRGAFGGGWGGWRLALRMARRDVRRDRGRSWFVWLMIAVPVSLIAALQVWIASTELSPMERAELETGGNQARITWAWNPFEPQLNDLGQVVPAEDSELAEPRLPPGWGTSLAAKRSAVARLLGRPVVPITTSGAEFGVSGLPVALLGVSPDPATAEMVRLIEGRMPASPGEVLVTTHGMRAGIPSSGTIELAFGSTHAPYTVVGRAEARIPGSYELIAPPETLNEEVGFVVPGDRPVTWEDAQRLAGYGFQTTSLEIVARPPYPLPSSGPGFGMGEVALVVGLVEVALLVGPAFAIGAARQRRSLALAALSGANPRQLRRVALGQALLLGSTATLAGTLAGAGAAIALWPVLTSDPAEVAGPLEVPAGYLVLLLALGTATALGSAWVTARGLGRLALVTALNGTARSAPSRRGPSIAGALLLGLGMVAAWWPLTRGNDQSSTTGLVWLAGGLAVLAGLLLGTPALLGALARLGGNAPATLRMALRDLARHRGRATAIVASVAGGVLALAAVWTIMASAEANEARDYVPATLPGRASVEFSSGGGAGLAGLEATIRSVDPRLRTTRLAGATAIKPGTDDETMEIAGLRNGCSFDDLGISGPVSPQCRSLMAYPRFGILVGETADLVRLFGLDAAQADALARGRLLVNTDPVQGPGGATVNEVRAGRLHLAYLDYEVGKAPRTVRVPATAITTAVVGRGVPPARYSVLASISTAEALGWSVRAWQVVVEDPDGPIAPAAEQRLRDALAAPGVSLTVERGFVPTPQPALWLVAGTLALLAVIGAAMSSILATAELRPFLATFTAIGASPTLTRRLAMTQSAVLALLASGLGSMLGLALGVPAGLVLTGWNGGEPIVVVPWVAAGLFVVAVPLIAGAVAAVATPARHPIGRRVD